ncbi:NUDIX hydrolase [Sediminihabitans luteus]|uniref:NUDIX hydrolase n=1 Tax=Sediminihabitans luteus TaxID=1138585 RepID=UPI001EF38810|nr:NUDIX hydrolase [Sediminihabitans luteus]
MHEHHAPGWLPAGSRADVVRDPGGDVPSPTCLVRLLLERDGEVFCVPREDGATRLDLPTRVVGALDPQVVADALAREVVGHGARPELLGYVRNVVTTPDAGYPWPAPLAHFTVWAVRGVPAVAGTWVPVHDLRERHWWPLVGTV